VGTTSLVLDLLEADCLPKVILADAVMTFRTLSHQPDGPWLVPLASGRCVNAVELLDQFWTAANREFRGRDTETTILLDIWRNTLDALADNPERLVGQVDWITKRWLFRQFMAEEKLSWNDPWLKSQDLEFHHIDPSRSLGLALAQTPREWEISSEEIEDAMRKAPGNTRAAARSDAMQLLCNHAMEYYVDWEILGAEGGNSLQLLDPFDASPKEAGSWSKHLIQPKEKMSRKSSMR